MIRPRQPSRHLLAVLLLAAMPTKPAHARATDARPLTPAEQKLFLPMLCTNAKPERGARPIYENRCDSLPGYRANDRDVNTPRLDITLTSIIRGSMTSPGKTEVYITYRGSFESHATLSGGGILLRRAGQIWKLIGWYPGEKRASCLALPHTMPLETLCQSSDGHADSSWQAVTVELTPPLPPRTQPRTTLSQQVEILRDNTADTCQQAHDPARRSAVEDPCAYRRPGRGFLLSLGQLEPSHTPGILAELPVTYVSPASVEKACKAQCFLGLPATSGTVIFKRDGKHISVGMPVPMQPYIDRRTIRQTQTPPPP